MFVKLNFPECPNSYFAFDDFGNVYTQSFEYSTDIVSEIDHLSDVICFATITFSSGSVYVLSGQQEIKDWIYHNYRCLR